MGRNKLSDIDKINKGAKRFDNATFEDLVKESKKIRLKTLRKLLVCYASKYLRYKEFGDGNVPIHEETLIVEGIQKVLGGTLREAYDFYITMRVISRLRDLEEFEGYRMLVKKAELENNNKQNERT